MKSGAGWLVAVALACSAGCAPMQRVVTPVKRMVLDPKREFDRTPEPAAPDYRDARFWAALPEKRDDADATPIGMRNRQADAPVDVFFIHPTTYFSRAGWNQPLDDEQANRGTEFALRAQASAFNEVGRVYAPQYRQMTLNGYLSASDADRDRALDLAYRDVRAAFDAFLSQWSHGRPFIIAAHSQGSGHGLRLVSELMSDLSADPALRKRLVAAYLVGAAVPEDALRRTIPGVPLCATPEQTGCAVFFNAIEADAFEPGERPKRFEQVRAWYPGGFRSVEHPRLLCVNPVTWRADGESSPQSAHLGAIHAERNRPLPEPQPRRVSARCDGDGLLQTTLPDGEWRQWWFGGDQHVNDYQLFYMDIRANAARRAAAMRGATAPAAAKAAAKAAAGRKRGH
ncbi:DUF3089 domain-containing protein [Lysobacter enzymogenes]|nr:DUF3089 domain-containing protein [Lysobacter enzymogenes]QCW25307.1 DUF3089 domain-containing protein [Lysobacter enzymogenes]